LDSFTVAEQIEIKKWGDKDGVFEMVSVGIITSSQQVNHDSCILNVVTALYIVFFHNIVDFTTPFYTLISQQCTIVTTQ
jgi:hypothetical protein